MKLRLAIKIQRFFEEPIKRNGRLRHRGIHCPYNHTQYKKSIVVCNRRWMDGRIPYIPSNSELKEREEIQICMLTDLLIDDENERDRFKEAALKELDDAR
ncbi:MAG: hypothetical protein M0R50_09130 [Candidatus Cloacimonetes bacterium]|nr:hypothetical protein [Candidatus Cloacimonadota bacterium]